MPASLAKTYRELKALLKPYERHFEVRSSHGFRYELWGKHEVELRGKPHDPIQFAALIIQGTYVGFYFTPIYVKPTAFTLSPKLSKMKTGKGCFHVKELDDELKKDIKRMLAKGLECYKKLKWV